MKNGIKMSNDFAERRQRGRQTAGRLQSASEKAGKPLDWFEGLYSAADGDIAAVPWANSAPHKGLAVWLEKNQQNHTGTAIDVGCGLGDNATALEKAGFDVTAFDLSQTAIDWAKKRNESSAVKFHQADLFALPAQWIGAFDFVHETYTIQSLTGVLRDAAFTEIASLVKPGGRLLAICRSRPDEGAVQGPPWPISPQEMASFEKAGLEVETFEEFETSKEGREIPHFRILYHAQEI